MRARDEADTDSEESLEVGGPFDFRAKARGPGAMLALLMVVCTTGVVGLVWASWQDAKTQHAEMKASSDEVKHSIDDNTYVLSLSQDKREALNLSMPDSLRNRLRPRHRSNDPE